MREKRRFMLTLTCVALLFVILTGCGQRGQEEERWVYRPMISINDDLFGDTGYTRDTLSDEWVMIGEIEKEVPQHEPMVKGEEYYVANTLPVGTELYGKEQDSSIIYAKYKEFYIRYEFMDEGPN